ncbi:MAG: DNA recombination protein RmuC, partial [Alistipes sp.]|nr:DNA recombination protein RmuC [Alistipes sp.]
MNGETTVILLLLTALCVGVSVWALFLRRENMRLGRDQAEADRMRRLAEEAREAAERRTLAAAAEVRALVERSTLAEARLEAAERKMAESRAEREKMEETFRIQFRNLAGDI